MNKNAVIRIIVPIEKIGNLEGSMFQADMAQWN